MPDDHRTGEGKRRRGMNCPVCGVHSDVIYGRVLDHHGTAHKMTPPRCGTCAEQWGLQHVFNAPAPYVIDSRVEPMTAGEREFFAEYEQQMRDSNPSTIQSAASGSSTKQQHR